MRNTKAGCRILALFTAFFCLPLLFSQSSEGSDSKYLKQQTHFSISAYNAYALPASAAKEENLEKNNLRLPRFCSASNRVPFRQISCWFGGRFLLLIAAYLICTVLALFHKGSTFTRRYIIKYIHDKDGHKA